MANARFLLENKFATASVLNGTGGSPTPPVRTEVAPWLMERALNSDRRSVWKLDTENATAVGYGYQIDIDLGSSQAVDCIALGGLSCPGGEIIEIAVGYANSYPTGSYTQMGSINLAALKERDVVFPFISASKRYWYAWIDATAPPVVGSFKGGAMLDIGAAPNFGAQMSPFRNRIEQTLEDGSVLINELGDEGADFSLTFSPVPVATGNLLRQLQKTSGSFVYVDPTNYGFGYDVFLKGGRVNVASVGGGLVSVSLELGRCP